MRTTLRVFCWMACVLVGSSASWGVPLGTGFTYQGQLKQNGGLVNGTIVMRFSLWDASSGGSQIGTNQVVTVSVVGGQFSALLNGGAEFGTNAFNGDARWLQVEICADQACSSSTLLSPRQPLTAAPYARYSAAPWLTTGSNVSYSGGNVGIGTTVPTSRLEIAAQDGLKIRGYQPYLTLTDTNSGGMRGIIQSANGSLGFYPENYIGASAPVVIENPSGFVGLGTGTPAAKLDVRGSLRLGIYGEYHATAGPEELAIVRGTILWDGTSLSGCCYTVDHPATGIYYITLINPPFNEAGGLTVTVTPRSATRVTWTTIPGPWCSFHVFIYSDSPDYSNESFDFIAVGERND